MSHSTVQRHFHVSEFFGGGNVFSGFSNQQKPGHSKHSSYSHLYIYPSKGAISTYTLKMGVGLESVEEGLLAFLSAWAQSSSLG